MSWRMSSAAMVWALMRLSAKATSSGIVGFEVMAHHGHVEVLVEGVDGVGIGRVGRGRQAIDLAGDPDDVRRVAAAGALGVIHVDGAAADGGERILQEPAFVQRVGVQLHLEVELVGDRKTGVDHRRHRAPVLVDLEADAAAGDLIEDRARPRGVAAAEEAEIDRPFFRRLQHLADVEGAAAVDADGDRPERAADHGRQSRRDGVLAELRGVEMHVDVDAARRRDHAFGIAHRGGGADDQLRMHAVHGRRVAGLADGDDLAVLDADVALDDAEHRIDHERVAEQHVERAHGAVIARRQAQPIAERLAAAVKALLARDGEVMLDLGKKRRVAETNGVARGRAVHLRVVLAAHLGHRSKLP